MTRVASIARVASVAMTTWLAACAGSAVQVSPGGLFAVEPVAETTISSLPPQPLYWQIERFASRQSASRDAQPHALFVDEQDATWRFTLATGRRSAPAGLLVAQIGPVPLPEASSYLLRINRAGGPPGARTPVHFHSGSEAFLVLSGSLCQRTEHGTVRIEAGQTKNGHMPEMVMQLESCGTDQLDQFVMFVVDAQKPFSTPARFNSASSSR